MANHVVIMAGGIGSRFWPMSTPECPKQFIDVLGTGKTMIQMTVARFAPLCPMENFWVVTGAAYVDIVRTQLPEIPAENILAEPCARNTAPCIAYACWKIAQADPSANIVVTPSDALVLDGEEFRRVIGTALAFTATDRRIVTIGITPTRPETGYGYIHRTATPCAPSADLPSIDGGATATPCAPSADGGAAATPSSDGQTGGPSTATPSTATPMTDGAPSTPDGPSTDGPEIYPVAAFREKPSLEVAKQYLADGNYLWNAGIFVWNVDTIMSSMRAYVPDLAAKMDLMAESFRTPGEAAAVAEIFPTCEKISIDYAVMEKADYIYTIPGDFGWSDVGTWGSLWTLLPHDEGGNAVVGENVHLYGCTGCIVHAPFAESVVLEGLHDSIIVERNGRLLICRLSEEQRIKDFEK